MTGTLRVTGRQKQFYKTTVRLDKVKRLKIAFYCGQYMIVFMRQSFDLQILGYGSKLHQSETSGTSRITNLQYYLKYFTFISNC